MFDKSKICNDVLVETYVNKYDLESGDSLEVMNFKQARQVVIQTLRQSSPQSIAKYLKCSTDNVNFNRYLIKNGIHPEQELLEGMDNFFSFVHRFCDTELGGYGDWIKETHWIGNYNTPKQAAKARNFYIEKHNLPHRKDLIT